MWAERNKVVLKSATPVLRKIRHHNIGLPTLLLTIDAALLLLTSLIW